jgi:hypothetical protein
MAGEGMAIVVAGYYGVDIAITAIKQQKELLKISEIIPGINSASKKVDQYSTCQEVTNNRCEDLMPLDKLTEIHEAQMLLDQHKTNVEEASKRLSHGYKRIYQDLVRVSIIEGALFTADLVAKIRSKIQQL